MYKARKFPLAFGPLDGDYFKSSIEDPKLMCSTFPLDSSNAGTDLTPATSTSFILALSSPK